MDDDKFQKLVGMDRGAFEELTVLTQKLVREVDEEKLTWSASRTFVHADDAYRTDILKVENFESGGASYTWMLTNYFSRLSPLVVERLLSFIEKSIDEYDDCHNNEDEFDLGGES